MKIVEPRKIGSTAMPVAVAWLQRKCACGQHAGGEECEECRKRKTLQRSARGPAVARTVPPIVHTVLRAPGRRLDPATRSAVESHFGHDFSEVRIHTDAQAATSARAVGALAYTVGRSVVFGEGHYAPETAGGRELLMHELTHVVQQRAAGAGVPGRLEMGAVGERSEREADAVARSSARDSGVATSIRTGPLAVQRLPASGDAKDLGGRIGSFGGPLPYWEATELLKCVQIMGKGNEDYCRKEVLGEEALPESTPPPASPCCPQPALPAAAPSGAPAAKTAHKYQAEFESAAPVAGVPVAWATDADLISLVKRESGFNPTAENKSSGAFGLFQMLKSTWKAQLPEVAYGSTDVCCQAVGGFRYIQKAYASPTNAWKFFQATTRKNASLAPKHLQKKAQSWIAKGWGGY